MADLLNDPELRQRRKSIGTIEVNGPAGNRVLALDELTQADAELAVKFGYKPVFKRVREDSPGITPGDWTPLTSK